MPSRIAILGGGPKAAAIAAKAKALRVAGYTAPLVTIYERDGIGAAWTGRNGYSDGQTELCTSPLRDVGFPYSHTVWGKSVAELMAKEYSWTAYLASVRGKYAEWVDRDLPHPTHEIFAEYLYWVVTKSGASVETAEVNGLRRTVDGRWAVACSDGRPEDVYDGVVITGSGPPVAPLPGANHQVLNGFNVWRLRTHIASLLTSEDCRVLIVGAGGTAAAAANWLLNQGFVHHPILIVGRPATLFTRTPNAFENRIFGNDEAWGTLTEEQQLAFTDRLNSGVVWDRVSHRLGRAENVEYVPGEAVRCYLRHGELNLEIRQRENSPLDLPASVIIDCRGFDPGWFTSLLGASERVMAEAWIAARPLELDRSFALSGTFVHGGLHVPGLGSSVGPAAGNLMALGWVADSILQSHLPADEIRLGPLV